ncbi:hypothetical protein N7468_005333 [Penicillium chermesinum]|uniref:BZIP domain-containing protein n=1 Tax=Penicillium chermesinum TaxID=63820 RepID=A0A9W9P1F8_9EURO|nr:uncharacterized protein N7468_005333 [Penicillium chermesinum]KAJ5232377.1 hypothetical protein N7468_005333 [Penicillium chermesinum]KAJ6172035.1 hypothetical protein N7470_001102 [Penicillium chermesinum]
MQGSEDSSSSQAAPESLPRDKQEIQSSPKDSIPATPAEIQGNSGPRLRSLKVPTSRAQSEMTEMIQKAPHSQDRPVRKRGRPRIQKAKDAAAIEARRLQIRRAQRTYRQKKETTIQTLQSRVEVLEQTLQNVSDLIGPADSYAVAHPALHAERIAQARRLILAEINSSRPNDGNQPQPVDQPMDSGTVSLRDIFGYDVSSSWGFEEPTEPYGHYQSHARSPSPLLNRLFPTNTIFTYSNQESNLARRLQRFCLEHVHRWLSDPHPDPAFMSRVFGLMPCIHDMAGVRRAFRRALHAEVGGALESAEKMQFYTLGGAGTHFPDFDLDGRPIYPENSRRPNKILRRLVRILRRGGIQDWDEDWSGDAEPDAGQGLEIAEKLISREERLRALGLEGDWFDCRDVQGYLKQQGLPLDGSSVWIDVPDMAVESFYGFSSDKSGAQFYLPSAEHSPSDLGGQQCPSQSSYVLDVECFFDQLLANIRFLGRAPGFRLWDVDVALRASIQRRLST